jgi:bifunctional non-homologous end joining protein LigD
MRIMDEGVPRGADLMLATLTDARFSDPAWVFERKLDGERCLAIRRGGDVRLVSRTDRDLSGTYPEVVRALAGEGDDLTVDGELVAFDETGATSFSRLQQRLGVARPDPELVAAFPVVLCAFDLLHIGKHDVRGQELLERKRRLRAALPQVDALRFVEHRERDGEALYEQACAQGWEGLIAKRAASVYRAGRSPDWLKFKCVRAQEFVIGGYTEPAGSREHLGALLVGYHEDGRLVYAGKVGTGFDRASLERLGALLSGLEQAESPFGPIRPLPKGVHWVRPELVAQIGFAEWTNAGRLRQPRYLGLRDDKRARDVVRESASRTSP